MNSACITCGSIFHGVDCDEDGVPEVPGRACADETCGKWICKAGCEELSFACDGCGHTMCQSHAIRFQGLSVCMSCLQETLEANEPECMCTQTDVDLFDPRGCDWHDDRSDFNRLMRMSERYERAKGEVA